ncbi:chemotaxis protein CheW [Algicola sagamiensis]|uniref:chemotaxis protein CheW n=1 Tax=Algicola sagamiensis TaxID=163869 RepID=UPI000370371F|nr:chemotaxis protein CheW [Algicola sagamiensis]
MSEVFANEKVMRTYLTALLEEEVEPDGRVAKLLEQVEVLEHSHPTVVITQEEVEKSQEAPETQYIAENLLEEAPVEVIQEPIETVIVNTQPEIQVDVSDTPVLPKETAFESSFQSLLFEVSGLTLAVPLIDLGGIHRIEKLNSIFGKPPWFKGVMSLRGQQMNVIDTALWVMPEKYDASMKDSLDYQYVIMLGNSRWGLACEKLIHTVTLDKDGIQWRQNRGKRPWLAGLVKEKMCALLAVNELVDLLESGLAK